MLALLSYALCFPLLVLTTVVLVLQSQCMFCLHEHHQDFFVGHLRHCSHWNEVNSSTHNLTYLIVDTTTTTTGAAPCFWRETLSF